MGSALAFLDLLVLYQPWFFMSMMSSKAVQPEPYRYQARSFFIMKQTLARNLGGVSFLEVGKQ